MRILTALLTISLLLIFTGCSDQPTSPKLPDTAGSDTDGVPPEVQTLLSQYAPTENEARAAADNADWDESLIHQIACCDIYSVTILWGYLFNYTPPVDDTTDWSGNLTTSSNGFVRIVYEIDFEDGQDYITPSPTPGTVGWVSFTSQDFDGIHLLVYLPRGPLFHKFTAIPYITIETDLYMFRFNSIQLANLDYFHQVDDRNGVAIHSRRLWSNACPGGFLDGTWIKEGGLGTGQGRLEGVWRDHNGAPLGYMFGTFWVDSANVDNNCYHYGRWEGWVTGLILTVIIAEMEGYWFYDDMRMCPMCGEGHGVFYGTFENRMGDNRTGKIFAEFGDYSLPPDDTEMPYIGIWQYDCPWVTPNETDP